MTDWLVSIGGLLIVTGICLLGWVALDVRAHRRARVYRKPTEAELTDWAVRQYDRRVVKLSDRAAKGFPKVHQHSERAS